MRYWAGIRWSPSGVKTGDFDLGNPCENNQVMEWSVFQLLETIWVDWKK